MPTVLEFTTGYKGEPKSRIRYVTWTMSLACISSLQRVMHGEVSNLPGWCACPGALRLSCGRMVKASLLYGKSTVHVFSKQITDFFGSCCVDIVQPVASLKV